MLSLRSSIEHTLYLLISVLINLILFNILFLFIFTLPSQEVEELPPLKVEIHELPPKVKGSKVVRKVKETKATGREKVKPSATSLPVGEKGQVPVEPKKKPRKSVNILEKIRSKVLKKLKERERLAKEVGEISAVVSSRKLTIRVGSRKLTYIPPPPIFKVKEFPSVVRIKIWVDPSGKVIKAIILQRSGIAEIDNGLLKLVKKLRFEPIDTGEIQEGVITFTFRAE